MNKENKYLILIFSVLILIVILIFSINSSLMDKDFSTEEIKINNLYKPSISELYNEALELCTDKDKLDYEESFILFQKLIDDYNKISSPDIVEDRYFKKANFEIGYQFHFGERAVNKDYDKALNYYSKSDVRDTISILYAKGDFAKNEKNYSRSYKFYKAIVDLVEENKLDEFYDNWYYKSSNFQLGRAYDLGRGIKKDNIIATRYYLESKSAMGYNNAGIITYFRFDSKSLAKEYFNIAAEKGSTSSARLLAQYYYSNKFLNFEYNKLNKSEYTNNFYESIKYNLLALQNFEKDTQKSDYDINARDKALTNLNEVIEYEFNNLVNKSTKLFSKEEFEEIFMDYKKVNNRPYKEVYINFRDYMSISYNGYNDEVGLNGIRYNKKLTDLYNNRNIYEFIKTLDDYGNHLFDIKYFEINNITKKGKPFPNIDNLLLYETIFINYDILDNINSLIILDEENKNKTYIFNSKHLKFLKSLL